MLQNFSNTRKMLQIFNSVAKDVTKVHKKCQGSREPKKFEEHCSRLNSLKRSSMVSRRWLKFKQLCLLRRYFMLDISTSSNFPQVTSLIDVCFIKKLLFFGFADLFFLDVLTRFSCWILFARSSTDYIRKLSSTILSESLF